MNTNFSLGNMRGVQLKLKKNMYNSILHNQKMLAHALKHNSFRQHAAPAPAPAHVPPPAPAHVPAPSPAHVPPPAFVHVPAPSPAHLPLPADVLANLPADVLANLPAYVPASVNEPDLANLPAHVPAPVHRVQNGVPKKNKFNGLLSHMNKQRKNKLRDN